MKRIIFIIAAFVFLLSATSCNPGTDSNTGKKSGVSDGEKMSEAVSFTDIDGNEIKLSDFSGKVVILDFWASWCPPCKASIPFYNRMYEKYADKGLVIIGADVNEENDVIRSAAKDLGIKYIVARPNNSMNQLFKVSSIPSMFIFDKEGRMIANEVGYSSSSDSGLEQKILEALNK